MKHRLFTAVAAGLLAVALTACGTTPPITPPESVPTTPSETPPVPPTKLTIGLTYQPDIQFSAVYIAAEQGFFADAGLDITIRHHGRGESLFGALQAGEEDIVFAGGDEMMQARSQGVDIVNIATVYQQYPVAILSPVGKSIHDVPSLTGLSVGLPGEFGANWFALLLMLKQAGMTRNDIDVVSIGYTQQTALMTGQVDAVVGFVNNDAVKLNKADFPVVAIPLTGLVGAGLGVEQKTLDQHTPALQAFWKAFAKAMAVCIDDPSQALAAAQEHVPGLEQPENQEMALAILAASAELYGAKSAFGQQNTETWAYMADFMAGADLLEQPVTATDAYTTVVVSGG